MAESAFQVLQIALEILKTFVIVEMLSIKMVFIMSESIVKFQRPKRVTTKRRSFVSMEDTVRRTGWIKRIGRVAVGQTMTGSIVNTIKERFQNVP
jgi:hypothetical protein